MRENSSNKFAASRFVLTDSKTLEQSRLQNQINLLKNKLRSNRNNETRKKLEYRISVVEQDIANHQVRLNKDKQNNKVNSDHLEQQIKQSIKTHQELTVKHKRLCDEQDSLKIQVSGSMNQNKELSERLSVLQRDRKEKVDQITKAERLQRLQLEDIKRLQFVLERLKTEVAAFNQKTNKMDEKLVKLTTINNSSKEKVAEYQSQIDKQTEEMKCLFKDTNNQLVEEEKSMHRHLLLRDSYKEEEHKLKQVLRKLKEITEMCEIEIERSNIIGERLSQTKRLIDSTLACESLDQKVEEETQRISSLKIRCSSLTDQNLTKQKLNEQVIQQMYSMTRQDSLFKSYLLRHQMVKELQAKCKIESYAWLSGSYSSRLYESRQKPRSFNYTIQPSVSSTVYNSSLSKGQMKFVMNIY